MAFRQLLNLPRYGQQAVSNIETAQLNNQFLLEGTDQEIIDTEADHRAFFLAYVDAVGPFTIQDKDGAVIASNVATPFIREHPGLRLDGGFKLIGTVNLATGFFVQLSGD